MDLAAELQRSTTAKPTSASTGGGTVASRSGFGDEVNGFLAEETFTLADGIMPWFATGHRAFLSGRRLRRDLTPEVRAAVAKRFRPPATGAQVRCPHCAAPN